MKRKHKNRILNFILWRVWDAQHYLRGIAAEQNTIRRFNSFRGGKPHSLDRDLIISLTSYPARFKYLAMTVRSLLTQTVQPDRVILWIAYEDMEKLPDDLLKLQGRHGFEIRPCDDLRSYKKLIPTLEAYPEAHIATADDDLYYHPNWLKQMLDEWDGTSRHVVGHRGFYLALDDHGKLTSCSIWQENPDLVKGSPKYFMPIGEGGIFYPAGCFHPDVTNRELCRTLSPNGDDFWFYWMARLNGARYSQVLPRRDKINWRGTQESGLFMSSKTLDEDNDKRLSNLVEYYGWQN